MVEVDRLQLIFFWTAVPFLVVGFVGNVLVVRIVHKNRDMHTPTNFLFVNLAVSDVITILLWPFYHFVVGAFICKFVVLIEISIVASSITVTVLAVERYHALLRPFRTGLRLSRDNIGKAIAFIWIASAITCIPEFFLKEWSDTHETCVGPWTIHKNQATKIYMITNVTLTFILLVVALYCYGSLIRALFFTNTVFSETVADRSLERQRLAVTCILASAAFFIAYTPTMIFYTFVSPTNKDEEFNHYPLLSGGVDFVFTCSMCFNPILYAFRGRVFKEKIKRIVLCRDQTPTNELGQGS